MLATTRDIYKLYVGDMHSGGLPMADVPGWGQQQIAAAQPVTSTNTSFRSDELLGTDVRNPENEALGSVDDLVMSPQTGKIAYLVITRGGMKNTSRITPNANLLMLDTTKGAMEADPQVNYGQFATPGHFDQRVRRWMPTGRRTYRTKAKTYPTVDSLLKYPRSAGHLTARGARNVVDCISDQRLRHRGK